MEIYKHIRKRQKTEIKYHISIRYFPIGQFFNIPCETRLSYEMKLLYIVIENLNIIRWKTRSDQDVLYIGCSDHNHTKITHNFSNFVIIELYLIVRGIIPKLGHHNFEFHYLFLVSILIFIRI